MSIFDENLRYPPGTLLVFIDETGHEAYSDPNYPVFGRGGYMVMSSEYNNRIVRPWKKLLQEIDWGHTPFHTSEFIQRLRSLDKATQEAQIESINKLARHGFYRFGVTTNSTIEFPSEIDGQAVVSGGSGNFLRRIVAIASRADLLVSGDKDLPVLTSAYAQVVSPTTLRLLLGAENPTHNQSPPARDSMR